MSKAYEDLSRRGLIKLNHDFDQENDGVLQQYLADHVDEYENIRPVEAVVNRVDQIVETVSGRAFCMKKAAGRKGGKIVEAVIDVVADGVNIIDNIAGIITMVK